MKKIVFFSALLSLSLVSCGDDDKPQDQTPIVQDPLVGKWNMVKGEFYQNGNLVLEEDLKPGDCNYDFYELKTGGVKDEVYHDEEDRKSARLNSSHVKISYAVFCLNKKRYHPMYSLR